MSGDIMQELQSVMQDRKASASSSKNASTYIMDSAPSDDEEDDVKLFLHNSSSPQHLPMPGEEEVYEAIITPTKEDAVGAARMSRVERIRLMKKRRAAEAEEKQTEADYAFPTDGPPRDMTSGMMQELQAILHIRSDAAANGLADPHLMPIPDEEPMSPSMHAVSSEAPSDENVEYWTEAVVVPPSPPPLQRRPAPPSGRCKRTGRRAAADPATLETNTIPPWPARPVEPFAPAAV